MSLKRRVLPPRPQPSERTAPPKPMKVIALARNQRGLRINCDGCFVIITRTERGTTVQVQRHFGHELLTTRVHHRHAGPNNQAYDTAVNVEANVEVKP